jgi:predicted DNA-binding transcriptional regulator AlpA
MQKRLRFRDLLERRIVNNRQTLRNWVRDHGFPPGQLTGPNSRTWGEDDVEAWLAARPTAPRPSPNPSSRRGRAIDEVTA